ncbi:MAG: SDR family NAD(P)-dependent oxidoreductase [Pirellulales bacterium]|nr:SDR family NAD(P)-dependent oxidoreductase [Pirellulales bacterium]
MTYWQDKVCVVTGGSAGLGLAIGRALAQSGAKVVLTARRKEPLEAAAAELSRGGAQVVAVAGDVAWQEDVDRIAATIAEKFGRVDLLCNCVGRSTRGAVLDATPEDFQQLLDVNFLATVRTTRALAPLLLQSRGHLVNIGSLACKVGTRFMGAYPASKFALAGYTQQLRLELADQGVHVMLVCPGPIAREDAGTRYAAASPGVPAAAQSPGAGARLKAIDPDKLAADILRACERRKPELVVPAKAKLLFAISQLSASWGDWLLRKSSSP